MLRPLRDDDLEAVLALQASAYAGLEESAAAMASRLTRAPSWCFGAETDTGELCAYLLTHPWPHLAPPEWNQPLGHLPTPCHHFYLHDLALGPAARGQGVARYLVQHALAQARDAKLHEARLVAVQDSVPFWERLGFHVIRPGAAVAATLHSYGDDARLMQQTLTR
ncbi:MAG: GNAT family N-acetyltransferase [Moraxellaceae bacterium]|nr:GNAT family N-acetyltransferase [Moraxellaceae bacterium]